MSSVKTMASPSRFHHGRKKGIFLLSTEMVLTVMVVVGISASFADVRQ
jgi:hypothetical protein